VRLVPARAGPGILEAPTAAGPTPSTTAALAPLVAAAADRPAAPDQARSDGSSDVLHDGSGLERGQQRRAGVPRAFQVGLVAVFRAGELLRSLPERDGAGGIVQPGQDSGR